MSQEHKARVERTSYQTFLNTTEITVSIKGEHYLARGDNIIVNTQKIPETTRILGRIETASEVLQTPPEA